MVQTERVSLGTRDRKYRLAAVGKGRFDLLLNSVLGQPISHISTSAAGPGPFRANRRGWLGGKEEQALLS